MSTHFNLSHFGWDNLIVPSNLQHLCAFLPTWKQLKALRAPTHLNSQHPAVIFPHAVFQNDPADSRPFLPAFEKGPIHSGIGTYAHIYRGTRSVFKPSPASASTPAPRFERTQPFAPICIKEVPLQVAADEDDSAYEEECKAILYEAFLHALLMKFLATQGLETAVPHLYEITATTVTQNPPTDPADFEAIWMTMELIEGETLQTHLSHVFELGQHAKNDRILLDILFQLTHILHLLQSALRFNHRDLKINNLFIRRHAAAEGWSRRVPAGDGTHIWECVRDLVLIDFGFSCIACGTGFENPRATLVGAGSYYGAEHDCMKVGRDLAHFLYSLHAAFPLQSYLSPSLFALLHNAVRAYRDGAEIDMWRGFAEDGTPLPIDATLPVAVPFNNGIYAFLRDGDTDVPGCAPAALAATLAAWAVSAGLL